MSATKHDVAELEAQERRFGITPPRGAKLKHRFRAVIKALKESIARNEARAKELEEEVERAGGE